MKHALRHLHAELDDLEKACLRRARPGARTADSLTFCSNDYLGLASHAARAEGHAGAGASRLISGERPEHVALEDAVAEWLGTESALTFTSGYAANVGLLSALAARGDLIVSDEHNHASIIDGARLSRAEIAITPHGNVSAVAAALEAHPHGRRWVVTEGYFSMDADSPDLGALRALCDRFDAALLVDEAHALGVLGPDGRGVAAAQGVTPDALVGTFGKAFGAAGAFVAGSKLLTEWLWNRARSFVFSTGLSPLLAECALRGLNAAREQSALRARTLAVAHTVRSVLVELGRPAVGYGHIIPIVVGAPADAVASSAALADLGVLVQAIRPPTVPPETSRLRIAASAAHSDADVLRLVDALRRAFAPSRSAP